MRFCLYWICTTHTYRGKSGVKEKMVGRDLVCDRVKREGRKRVYHVQYLTHFVSQDLVRSACICESHVFCACIRSFSLVQNWINVCVCVNVCINISWIRLRRNRWASVQHDVVIVMHFVFIFVWPMDLLELYRSASVHISRWEDRDRYGCWSILVILSIGKFSIFYTLFIRRSVVVIYFFLSKLISS